VSYNIRCAATLALSLELRRAAGHWARAKLKLVKKHNHVLAVPGAHLHMDHALPYTTLLWVAMASVINFVLVSINSPYHGGSSVVRCGGLAGLLSQTSRAG